MRATLIVSLFGCMLVTRAMSQCQQSQGILKLVDMDRGACMQSAIPECSAKMQLTVLPSCVLQLQPDVPVSTDGTFCNPSKGAQSRDAASGKLLVGRYDLDFSMRPLTVQGVVAMNLRGRIVPNTGGLEFPVDCNLLFNVTGGTAFGIISQGSDSLMGTATAAAQTAGPGGYTGAALPGMSAGAMGGSVGSRRGGVDDASGASGGRPSRQRSGAGAAVAAVGGAASAFAAGVLALLL